MPLTQNNPKAAGAAPQQFLTASSGYRSATATEPTERATTVVRPGREKIISVTLIALRFGSRHSLTLPASSFSSILPLLISRRSIAINELTVIADRLPIGGDRVRREASEEKTRREASERVEGDAAMR